jgi:integrase
VSFIVDKQELKTGLIIFRRSDVKHRNWYCRIKVPKEDRYKTISLETPDIHKARDDAFEHDADIRFRVKHEVPVFDKSFADVATEYSDNLKQTAQAGQITMDRWGIVDGYIRLHLIPYMGNIQIAYVGEDKWKAYTLWRKQEGKNKDRKRRDGTIIEGQSAKDGTIRQEMMTFRAIMNFAADKQYIRERQVPKGKLPSDKARREEFTPAEYRHLHTFARGWIKAAKRDHNVWYRNMAYNFMLVMANTGMRTMEASNLRWRDVDVRADKQGRSFAVLNVRGKDKFRELVAPASVAEYLDRIRELQKEAKSARKTVKGAKAGDDADSAIEPDDFVFTTHKGKSPSRLYNALIEDLLTESNLLHSSSGSRRSSYCFRHTYATFRLTEGVDVYFLAKQMGTSVQMIEDYYGHITPAKNAERILQGIPGWEPIADGNGATGGSVNAGAAGDEPAKPRKK